MMIEGIYDGFRCNPFSRPGWPGAEQRDDEHGATLDGGVGLRDA
jgi:hypothetical protein